jgi:hypothetical protein
MKATTVEGSSRRNMCNKEPLLLQWLLKVARPGYHAGAASANVALLGASKPVTGCSEPPNTQWCLSGNFTCAAVATTVHPLRLAPDAFSYCNIFFNVILGFVMLIAMLNSMQVSCFWLGGGHQMSRVK